MCLHENWVKLVWKGKLSVVKIFFIKLLERSLGKVNMVPHYVQQTWFFCLLSMEINCCLFDWPANQLAYKISTPLKRKSVFNAIQRIIPFFKMYDGIGTKLVNIQVTHLMLTIRNTFFK